MNFLRLQFGWTLVEMLVVIAIIGILAGGLATFLGGSQSRVKLENKSLTVVKGLKSLEQQAKSRDNTLRALIDVDDNSVTFERCIEGTSCDADDANHWDTLDDLPAVRLADDLQIYSYFDRDSFSQTGKASIKIESDGSSSYGGIHITFSPTPDESDRCQFYTIVHRGGLTTPRQYSYGKSGPFDDDIAECE